MALYQFKTTLEGYGNTPDEAWINAIEGVALGLSLDIGERPEKYEIIAEINQRIRLKLKV